jgi:hypothetical protein
MGAVSALQRLAYGGGVRCRRCSERQRGGEAWVSEWFVSEGRLDYWGLPEFTTPVAL